MVQSAQMNFLKTFGLAILGVILFLCLSFFGLVFTLDQTFLNPEFTIEQLDRLDTASLAEDIVRGQVVSQATLPINLLPIELYITAAIHDTVIDLQPWIQEQTREVTYTFYDYLESRSQYLSIVIDLEPVKESVQENISRTVIATPPPGLTDLPPDTIERYLEPYYARIPSSFEVDQAWLGAQNMAQLEQLRQLVSHFYTVYYVLIGLGLALILAIILIHHSVRGSTRCLGFIFFSCGAVTYGGFWLLKYAVGTQIAHPQVPAYLQGWLPQFLADTLSPLGIYSLALAGAGIVLLVVSFAYRRQEAY